MDQIVDPAKFKQVQDRLPHPVVTRILTTYNESGSGYVATIEQGFQDRNAEAVGRAAHTLRSSTGLIGSPGLTSAAQEMEATIIAGGWPTKEQVAKIREMFDRSLVELKHLHQ